MAVPGFQELMLPFLTICSDGRERTVSEVGEALAGQLNLSADDLRETLSSGQTKLYNRTAWVKSYFGKAGLLDFPSRGKFKITNRGVDLLKTNPETIRIKTLDQFPEFVEFRSKSADVEGEPRILNASQGEEESTTPEERLDDPR